MKSNSPSFGWWGGDDLFYYCRRKLNESREQKREEQIAQVRKIVTDDVSLLSKRLSIPVDFARAQYDDYLNIGGIKPKLDGNEIGMNKVMGYSVEKLNLLKKAIVPIIISLDCAKNNRKMPNNINVPNGILLYGPRGTGKSYMVESLAEHLKVKAEEKKLYINTITLAKDWKKGDTKENLDAVKNAFEQNENYDKRRHTIINIENLDVLTAVDDNEELIMEFAYQMMNSAKKGITWIVTTNNPKELPDWLYAPSRLSIAQPVREMSAPEASAVMSYMWAQANRKDDSNHDVILNHMQKNNICLNPPQFKEISDIIRMSLWREDLTIARSPHYIKPIKTDRVINEINAMDAQLKLEDPDGYKFYQRLAFKDDDEYVVKKMNKHN